MNDYDLLQGDSSDLRAPGRKKVIYLATPYTHESAAVEEHRFLKVTEVSGLLLDHGIVNISPITQSHEQCKMFDLDGTWEFWQHIDREFLHRCDELYVLCEDGWQTSVGVAAEIEYMTKLNKPIKYLFYAATVQKLYYIPEEQARGFYA